MQKLQLTCKSSSGKLVDIDVVGANAGAQPVEAIAIPMQMDGYINVLVARVLLSTAVAKIEDDRNLQQFIVNSVCPFRELDLSLSFLDKKYPLHWERLDSLSGALVFSWNFQSDAVFDRLPLSHLGFLDSVHFLNADDLAVFQPMIAQIVGWTHPQPKNARTTLWYSLQQTVFTIIASCEGLQWSITFTKEKN